MNIVELQYKVLKALEADLGKMDVQNKYGTQQYRLTLDGAKQRAIVSVSVETIIYCKVCKEEIHDPAYKQTTHDDCPEDEDTEVSS